MSVERIRRMLVKEFIQLGRDRVSFAMIVMMPLIQLLLFGYAINTQPRDLPTAEGSRAELADRPHGGRTATGVPTGLVGWPQRRPVTA